MVTKKEYEKAKETIHEYDKQVSSELIEDYTCCVCKKNRITPLEKHRGGVERLIDPLGQNHGIWNNGVVEQISMGYGSRYDTNYYYIAICDDCIEELEKKGYITNYKKLKKKVNPFYD